MGQRLDGRPIKDLSRIAPGITLVFVCDSDRRRLIGKKMKVCTLVFGVLLACVSALEMEHGHIIEALQPRPEIREVVFVEPAQSHRQKRSFLLGAGALGLGALGAGALGVGALGAGALGAGALIGAKAGFVGGALASSYGRSYGGYGRSYGSYGYGGGYGGYGSGYDSGYRSYPSYYSSYPSYYSSWC